MGASNVFLVPFFFFTKKKISVPGLSLIYLGQRQKGMEELEDAASQKATEEHSVIDEAIRDGGEGYTVLSIVRSVKPCFRLKTVDWICSPSVSSTVRPRTSSRMPRPATFWAKRYVSPNCRCDVMLDDRCIETRRNGEP